jgi:tetratricopeptide (TPR) repeat protein
LEEAFGRVVRTRTPRAVTVLGAAGIGKSRLAGELRSLVAANAAFLVGRCLPYGQGVTFWPVRSIVSEGAGSHSRQAIVAALADVDDADSVAESLSAALGPEAPPTTTEQIAWAFRLFCESLARRRPLVLVLDDLHWAEPPFLDLVENLVDRSCDAPMLVLCLAREDLLDDGSSFLQNQERAETLLLEALEADESEALAEALCTESGLPPEIQSRMVAGAEGNPLFLEQLVALAAEEGGAAAEQPLPATIQALLLARLDRLGPGERGVLERAAVIGREFRREPLAELVEPAGIAHLRRHLDVLVLRGFVRQEGFEPAYHEAFRFRHALIQAAVYGGTAKALRARLHEGYARWLAARSGLGEAELDTVMGYHLEQAHRHRSALGPTDDHTHALALEAGSRLGSAGIRSWKSGDARSSTNLLRRATTLLPATDTRRGELLCELGVALGAEGDSADAQDVLREALSSGADRRVELRARIELAYLHLLDRPLEGPDELLDVVSSAIPLLDELGDDRALGRAWLLAGFVRGAIRCQHAAWLENAERALGHHERSGWPTAACIGQIAAALYYGPAFVTAAIIRCSELRRDAPTDRVAEAHLHVFLGGLEAQRGHFDGARELVRIGRDVYDDLGYTRLNATHGGTVTADIALLAGDPAAAETELRSTCETLLEMRDLSNLATHAADLAEALYAQGHDDAAEAWTRISETHAGPDDLTAQPSWRSIRAKVLARRGDVPGAEALARDALRLADRTDALNARAKVELDLAETLRLAGRLDESATHVTRAVRLYDLKGNTAAARTARSLLEEPATA